MPAKMIPATIADKPAQRMSFGVVIFILLSLIAVWRLAFASLAPSLIVVFLLIFICLSPFLNHTDKYQRLAPGIAACLGSSKYNIQMNVGSCRPHVWGFMWGYTQGMPGIQKP